MKTKYNIIEAIYEIVNKTEYEKQARKYLDKLLKDKNVSISKDHNTITIENHNGERILHTLTIK